MSIRIDGITNNQRLKDPYAQHRVGQAGISTDKPQSKYMQEFQKTGISPLGRWASEHKNDFKSDKKPSLDKEQGVNLSYSPVPDNKMSNIRFDTQNPIANDTVFSLLKPITASEPNIIFKLDEPQNQPVILMNTATQASSEQLAEQRAEASKFSTKIIAQSKQMPINQKPINQKPINNFFASKPLALNPKMAHFMRLKEVQDNMKNDNLFHIPKTTSNHFSAPAA